MTGFTRGMPITDSALIEKLSHMLVGFMQTFELPAVDPAHLKSLGVEKYVERGFLSTLETDPWHLTPSLAGVSWDKLFLFRTSDCVIAVGFYWQNLSVRPPIQVGVVYNGEPPDLDKIVKIIQAWRRLVMFRSKLRLKFITAETAAAVVRATTTLEMMPVTANTGD